MFVELHILQNFAPSNLNRDDTGSPKSAAFGGYRRARISSQCIKRAIRTEFTNRELVPSEHLAHRTKRAVDAILDRLDKPEEEARPVVERMFEGIKLNFKDAERNGVMERKSEYLVYLAEAEINGAVQIAMEHWDELSSIVAPASGRTGSARAMKRAGQTSVSRAISNQLSKSLDGGKAADLALFGRMLADLPERNVDAASQVAHAVSTHQVSTEFDFYTAVDDLLPEDTSGADMLGTVEFNSACYYRYSNVDMAQLLSNLGDDAELAQNTLEAFVRASVSAVPTGKQNSFAARNYPSLVFAIVRDSAPCSLANAFEEPVRPNHERGLVVSSVLALDSYWGDITAMYGEGGIRGRWVSCIGDLPLSNLAGFQVSTVDDVVAGVLGSGVEEGASV